MAYAPPPQQQYEAPAAYAAPPQQSYAPPSFAGAPGAGAEVEVHDGSRAMEVQTIFRGVVTGTRHLFNPEGKNTHGQRRAAKPSGRARNGNIGTRWRGPRLAPPPQKLTVSP